MFYYNIIIMTFSQNVSGIIDDIELNRSYDKSYLKT